MEILESIQGKNLRAFDFDSGLVLINGSFKTFMNQVMFEMLCIRLYNHLARSKEYLFVDVNF